MSIKRRKSLW